MNLTVEQQRESDLLAERFKQISNQADFARKFDVPGGPSMVSQHIKGRRPISLDAARAYAKGFGIALSEISKRFAGLTTDPDLSGSSTAEDAPNLRPDRLLTVVGQVKGGVDGYLDETPYEGWVRHPSSDPKAFALRVLGDSMHPRFRAGEFVIVEPSIEPQDGDDVVVVCKNGRKLLKQLNWRRDGEIQLLSINSEFAPLTLPLDEVETVQLARGRAGRSAFVKP